MSADEFGLEGEIASAIDEYLADEISYRGIRHSGQKYEFEECDQPDDAWILVRESDGQRFELEFDVHIRKLPPKPPEADPDAPVHIEGQEEIPLTLGGRHA